MILLIDNYDSFTFNLIDYFKQLGEEILHYQNDQLNSNKLKSLKFDKVVIAPGPRTPYESGNLMELINELYLHYPILGICLGHQALGQFFGAKLIKAKYPMHGKVSAITHHQKGIYKNLPNPIDVCRYHSLIISNLIKTPLIQCAQTNNGECMSFCHSSLPIWGVQYHPEAILTSHGMAILKNWLELTY